MQTFFHYLVYDFAENFHPNDNFYGLNVEMVFSVIFRSATISNLVFNLFENSVSTLVQHFLLS